MRAVIGGVPVYGDARLERDQMFASEAGIWMHPLAVIGWKHRDDPHARLAAVLNWIEARIDHQAKMATLRLEPPTDDEIRRQSDG